METSFLYNSEDKNLCFRIKEKVSHGSIQLKFGGTLNTVTGAWEQKLSAYFFPLLQEKAKRSGWGRKPIQLKKTEVKVGPFFCDDHQTPNPRLGIHLGIERVLGQQRETSFGVSIDPQMQLGSNKNAVDAGARVSRVFRSITSNQDLKVGLEYHATLDHMQKIRHRTTLKIRENNWGIMIGKESFNLTYDL